MKNALAPFDKVLIDGYVVGPGVLVQSFSSVASGGQDKSFAASDGSSVNVRAAVLKSARFRALGDFSSLASPPGWPLPVTLCLDGVAVLSFNALVSASFSASERTTSFRLEGEPEA